MKQMSTTSCNLMKRLFVHKHTHVALFLALIMSMISYFIFYEASIDQSIVADDLKDGILTPAQSKSIDTVLGLAHLMIGWAIAIIGATGYFIKTHIEKQLQIRPIDLYISVSIISLCVSSVYFGHLGVDIVAEMLSFNQFPVGVSVIKEVFMRQYIVLISAIGLFGIHIIQYYCRQLTINNIDTV